MLYVIMLYFLPIFVVIHHGLCPSVYSSFTYINIYYVHYTLQIIHILVLLTIKSKIHHCFFGEYPLDYLKYQSFYYAFKYPLFYRCVPLLFYYFCFVYQHLDAENEDYSFLGFVHDSYMKQSKHSRTRNADVQYLKNYYESRYTRNDKYIFGADKYRLFPTAREKETIKFILVLWNKDIDGIQKLIQKLISKPYQILTRQAGDSLIDKCIRILQKNYYCETQLVVLLELFNLAKLRKQEIRLDSFLAIQLHPKNDPVLACVFIKLGARIWKRSINFQWNESLLDDEIDEYKERMLRTCLREQDILYLLDSNIDLNFLRRFLLCDGRTTGNDIIVKLEKWCVDVKPCLQQFLPNVLVSIVTNYIYTN